WHGDGALGVPDRVGDETGDVANSQSWRCAVIECNGPSVVGGSSAIGDSRIRPIPASWKLVPCPIMRSVGVSGDWRRLLQCREEYRGLRQSRTLIQATWPSMKRITIYDTTLRDGSQGEGVNFSLQDKLLITSRLDGLGIDYIEGGYPLSNPKDAAYFRAV